jgi:hypothetical protein
MATTNDFTRSFSVNAALSAFRRVAVSNNGSIDYANNGILGVGILQQDVTNDSFYTPSVRFYSVGTYMCAVTSVPVTIGDTVYAAVNGYVSSTGTVVAGRTLTSASVNGTWIEVIPPAGTIL